MPAKRTGAADWPGADCDALPASARAALADLLRDSRAVSSEQALARAGWTGADGALLPDRALLLASDIGGTKALTALCTLDGTVLAETKEPTAEAGGAGLVGQVVAQRDALLARTGRGAGEIAAAGIGLPASIHPGTGRLHRGPNIAGLEDHDVIAHMGRALGVPAAVENDVNMAALGESWLGGGRDAECAVFIAIGTGIGMGIVVRGELLRGATGAAGEIAFLPLGADPFDPATRPMGALESVISSPALIEAYREAGGAGKGSLRDLFAAGPDPALDEVVSFLSTRVAEAVLAVSAILDPGRITLGGSIGAREEVLEGVRHALSRCMTTPPDCHVSSLGNRAGVMGGARAARLALADAL